MQKISDSTSTANAAGEFTEGSATAGVAATLITADWLNSVQRELLAVLSGAGMDPNGADDAQVLAAIKAVATLDGVTPGRLIGVKVFTASGTYAPTAGMKSVIVEGVGAGGGSGGTTATGSGQASLGGGGASGAYARGRFTAAQVGASQAITVGAGGTAGPATTGNAGTGGTTSFGSLMSAPGGGGGSAGSVGAPPTFMGAGGLPSSAPVGANIVGFAGNTGGAGMLLGVTTGLSGLGSSSPFGAGGAPQGSAVGAIGLPGTGYGSGAGGSSNAQSQAARVGAAGQPGILIVWEYA